MALCSCWSLTSNPVQPSCCPSWFRTILKPFSFIVIFLICPSAFLASAASYSSKVMVQLQPGINSLSVFGPKLVWWWCHWLVSGSCVRIMSNYSLPFILSTFFMFLKQFLPDYNWNGHTDIWDLLYLKALFHFCNIYNNTHFLSRKTLKAGFSLFQLSSFHSACAD